MGPASRPPTHDVPNRSPSINQSKNLSLMGEISVPLPLLPHVKLHRPLPGLTRLDDCVTTGEYVFLLYAFQRSAGVLLSDVMMILSFYLLTFCFLRTNYLTIFFWNLFWYYLFLSSFIKLCTIIFCLFWKVFFGY